MFHIRYKHTVQLFKLQQISNLSMNNLMSPSFSNISSTLPYACSPDLEKQDRIATRDSQDLTILPEETHEVKRSRLSIFGLPKKSQAKNQSDELYCISLDIRDSNQVKNQQKDTQRIHTVSRTQGNINQKYVNTDKERKKGRIFNSTHLKNNCEGYFGNQKDSRVMISSTKRLKEKIDQIIQKTEKENIRQKVYQKYQKRYSFDCPNSSGFDYNFTAENSKKMKQSNNIFKTIQYCKEDHSNRSQVNNIPVYQSFICRDETSRCTFEQLHTNHKNPAVKKIKNNTKTIRKIEKNSDDIHFYKKSVLLSQFSPQKYVANKLNKNTNNNQKFKMTQERYFDKQAQTSRLQQKISYRNIDILKQSQNNEQNSNIETHNLFMDFQSSRRCSAFNTPEALRKNKSITINEILLSHPVNKEQMVVKPIEQNRGKVPYTMIIFALILLLLQILR